VSYDIETQEPESSSRTRVRWYHVLTLGLAVLVCAAAVGFAVSQSSDRDDATSARESAQAALTEQRESTARARELLAGERKETKATLAQIDEMTAALHEINDLAAQELDAVNAAYQSGVTNPDDVDAYNAQVARSNALLDVMQAKGEEVVRLEQQLRHDAEAQTAAVR
jgi:hypothetical protein